jgi:hypothetical protein
MPWLTVKVVGCVSDDFFREVSLVFLFSNFCARDVTVRTKQDLCFVFVVCFFVRRVSKSSSDSSQSSAVVKIL